VSDLFLGAPEQEHDGVPSPSRRSRRDTKEQQTRDRKHRRRRSVVVLVLALALVGGAAFVVWSVMGGLFSGDSAEETVQDYPGPGSGDVQVTVAPGDSGGAIGQTLHDAGVVATVKAFTTAYAANSAAQSIQPGTYTLQLEMRASDAVNALLASENRVSSRVTIPEGYTAKQVFQRVYEVATIPVEDLEAAAADAEAIGLPAEAGGNVEGWLFPATYEVEPGATAESVLSQMVAKTVGVLTEKGVTQDQWETVPRSSSARPSSTPTGRSWPGRSRTGWTSRCRCRSTPWWRTGWASRASTSRTRTRATPSRRTTRTTSTRSPACRRRPSRRPARRRSTPS